MYFIFFSRANVPSNKNFRKHDVTKRQVRVVSKTVQVFISDVRYHDGGLNQYDSRGNPPVDQRHPPYEVLHPVLERMAKKIELATQMRVLGKHSSTDFQVIIIERTY